MGKPHYPPQERPRTYRLVSKAPDGSLRTRDFSHQEPLLRMHTQVGVDDCSTDLALRGLPVFKELVGPMPEGKSIARYETPEVFEELTKEWVSNKKAPRKRKPS